MSISSGCFRVWIDHGGRCHGAGCRPRWGVRVTVARRASADEITKKLAAMREARDKARAELVDAQKALKEKLTPRQEAVLVTLGLLD